MEYSDLCSLSCATVASTDFYISTVRTHAEESVCRREQRVVVLLSRCKGLREVVSGHAQWLWSNHRIDTITMNTWMELGRNDTWD